MTINELREKRNQAWQGAKAFVESKRDKDGLLSAEDTAAYKEMEKKVQDYSAEIERMEQMEAMERELSKPVNTPIVKRACHVIQHVAIFSRHRPLRCLIF